MSRLYSAGNFSRKNFAENLAAPFFLFNAHPPTLIFFLNRRKESIFFGMMNMPQHLFCCAAVFLSIHFEQILTDFEKIFIKFEKIFIEFEKIFIKFEKIFVEFEKIFVEFEKIFIEFEKIFVRKNLPLTIN